MATAIPSDFVRIGYRNGQIPDCVLRSVKGLNGVKLHPQAADQLKLLLEAARRAGFNFTASGYRTYDAQISAKQESGIGAATPGQSMHGWGTAIDISELFTAAQTKVGQLNGQFPARPTKVNRYSPEVHKFIRETNSLYRWLAENAPKYGWVNPEWAKNGGTVDESWHWEYQAWPQVPDSVTFKPTVPPVTSRCGRDTPIRERYSRTSGGPTAPQTPITPFIASLESFHPRIQYELTRRRISTEMANTHMPFVKLTSLVNVLGQNIQGSAPNTVAAWCPSLGVHGQNNVNFEDIYLPQNNRSIVGYAWKKKAATGEVPDYETVPIVVDESAARNTDQRNIPIPGIVDVSTECGTAGPMGIRGGLTKATIKIAAYSVGQVDTLLRYFLRPATRVVLEWGRRSANPEEVINPYNWKQSSEDISTEFSNLIYDQEAQQKFIQEYVYKNNGNYEILIGYVVKFDLKYNKDNVYDITLVVHSVQQFEVPTKHTGVKSFCAEAVDKCAAMDIEEYFSEASAWKQKTFKRFMQQEEENAKDVNYEWSKHFTRTNNRTPESTGGGSSEAGTEETEYLVSWQFFVDKILNDEVGGVASIIPDADTRKFIKTGLLKSTRVPDEVEKALAKDNLIANEVGYHPALRSVNPNVMVIYNSYAENNKSPNERQDYVDVVNLATTDNEQKRLFNNNTELRDFIINSSIGSFRNVVTNEDNRPAAGYLTNGVWLNTKVIKEVFTANDTVSMAINALLSAMNAATEGYWNLQLYSSARPNPGMFVIDWGLAKKLSATSKTIEDQNNLPWIDKEGIIENGTESDSIQNYNFLERYQKSIDDVGANRPNFIYMFNRGTKRFKDGELGSDIIDLKVEFDLPQVIAVQAIAGVGGPAQKSTLQSLDIPQLNQINLLSGIFANCTPSTSTICADPTCVDPDLITAEVDLNVARTETEKTEASIVRGARVGTSPLATALILSGEAARSRARTFSAESTFNSIRAQRTFGNSMVVDTVRELSSLGQLLELIEFNRASMMKKMNIDSTNAEIGLVSPDAHAFNSSNLTKTIASVTLPGIGGIDLFQSFLIDRVPSILERGFYVTTKINHKFSSKDGWITTIEGRFRYRPIKENSGTGYPECGTLNDPNVQASGGGTRGFAQGLFGAAAPTGAGTKF